LGLNVNPHQKFKQKKEGAKGAGFDFHVLGKNKKRRRKILEGVLFQGDQCVTRPKKTISGSAG